MTLVPFVGRPTATQAMGGQRLRGEIKLPQLAVGVAEGQRIAPAGNPESRHRDLWRDGQRGGGQLRVGKIYPMESKASEFPGCFNPRHKAETAMLDGGQREDHLSTHRVIGQAENSGFT